MADRNVITGLEASRVNQENDAQIVWVGDGNHRGTDVYWSPHLRLWVFVDLENRRLQYAEKIAVYTTDRDGDEVGLNQATVFACDLDGQGLWVLGMDAGVDEDDDERVELLWTDSSAVADG